MLNFIRKLLKKAPPAINPIQVFNTETNNTINSAQAALKAIKGHHIEVGPNTSIDDRSSVGSYTYIGTNCTITKADIGRYCSIANNVTIGPGEHILDALSTSSLFYTDAYDELTQKECTIGNDVWIGVDCIIKRGVTINNGAVIGANAVVTRDVPAYAVVLGSPARLLKYRFTPMAISILSASRWWEAELSEAQAILNQLKIELGGNNG